MSRVCNRCQQKLPEGAPGNRCPKCLLELGLDEDVEQRKQPAPTIHAMEQAGDRIGRYKLLQQIGEGGCGMVYMAEQLEPVRRRVALKVIKLGLDTRSVIARFEAERQALALMEHPHIAQVLDAGTTETGRPYFVMELVRGIKITDYCDENHLSMTERLKLFIQVCQAVQHAHQKGIIHRDLKPSNILVTVNDAVPVPKVIDFGIAKATNQQQLTDKTVFTAFEQFMGTPAYMSPEQAVMTSLDIDTRSDIYSLGVLLYELLTGKTPFDAEDLLKSGVDEMRRTIREKEPVRPSTRLATLLEGDLTTTARNRQTDAPKLIHLLKGDLDWIVMKALEKDRTRRYETANGFGMDIQRYLNNEPVIARPQSNLYRFQKMVRRNSLAFSAGAGVVAALLIGLGVSISLFLQERKAHTRAVAAEREQARFRQKAERAEHEKTEELWQSHFQRAQAERQTPTLGRRARSLEAISAAAQIRPTRELRDAAAATLALVDLQETDIWCPRPLVSSHPEWTVDSQLKHFALPAPGAVNLWSIPAKQDAGQLLHGGGRNTRYLRFSPDGQSLAVKYYNRDFVVWDVSKRAPRFVARLLDNRDEEDSLYGFDFSSDGQVAGCSDREGLFHLYDVPTGRELRTLQVTNAAGSRGSFHHGSIYMARFNPRFASVALAAGNTLEIWDLNNNRIAQRTNLPNATRLAWHPNGVLLAYVNWFLPEIVLWNTATGKERLLHSSSGSHSYLAFSPQGDLLATCGLDGVTRLWDLTTDQTILRSEVNSSLEFDATGHRLAFDHRSKLAGLWEVVKSPVCRSLRHVDAVSGVAYQVEFTDGGRHLVWHATDGFYRFDTQTGDIERGLSGWNRIVCLDESADGMWTLRQNGIVRLENLWKATPPPQQLIRSGGEWCWLGFAPQRRLLGVANLTNVSVLAIPAMNAIFTTNLHVPRGLAISPDGAWLAACSLQDKDQVLVYDIQRQSEAGRLPIDATTLLFDPKGRWLASGTVDACRLWETGSWREVRRFSRESSAGRVLPMAFPADGRWFAYARSPAVIELIETESGRSLVSLEAPARLQLRGLSFNPAGDTLAAAAENGVVQLWNLAALNDELARLGLAWEATTESIGASTNSRSRVP